MKKLFIVASLALSLGACAQLQSFSGAVQTAIVGVSNPVTKSALYNFENSMIVAFAGLKVYKQSCVSGAIPASCKAVIARLQVYTRQIPNALRDVRIFVKNNDMVNAQIAFNTAKQLYNDFVADATTNGIKVQ